jgi:flavin reductase (DIM6/NTAB) family NADH-FMN oxidoreductase RutF
MQKLDGSDYIKVIGPPPVVLLSTLYGEVANVAPYGMVMPVSFDPPLMAFGIKEERDTFRNIRDNDEFVVAYPTPELAEAVNKTAEALPRDKSEFAHARLTCRPSATVKPHSVGECPVNIECKLEWMRQAGDHYVVVGRAVAVTVSDELAESGLSRMSLRPLYHLSAPEHEYAELGRAI